MAMPVQKVMRLIQEGERDRDSGVCKDRYPRGSDDWRWWASGWLDRDRILKKSK